MIQGTSNFGFFGGDFSQSGSEGVGGFGASSKAGVTNGFAATLQQVTSETTEPSALNLEAAISALELPEFSGQFEIKGDAIASLEKSIKKVSELLGIDIDFDGKLGLSEGEEISDEMLAQLSELLTVLKELPPLLRGIGAAGESVEIAGTEVTPEIAAEVAKTLDQERVNVQLALTTLEVGGEVALQTEGETSFAGLTVATNPEELTQDKRVLPESLTKLFEVEEEELTDILSRIRKMVSNAPKTEGDESSKLALSALKGEVGASITENVIGETVTPEQAEVKSETQKAAVNLVNPTEVEVAKSLTTNDGITDKPAEKSTSAKIADLNALLNRDDVEVVDAKLVDGKIADSKTVETETAASALNALNLKGKGVKEENTGAVETKEGSQSSSKTDVVSNLLKQNEGDEQQQHSNEEGEENDESFADKAERVGLFSTADKSETTANTKTNDQTVASLEQSVELKGETAPTEKATARPFTARVFEEQIVKQVSTGLAEAAKEGVREITLILKPKTLGEVQITIQVENDIVAAKLSVESQQVKQIIENNFDSLRDALSDHDLSAGSLDVNVGSEADREAFANKNGKSGMKFAHKGNDEDMIVADLPGTETGRRFGTNSFEYFA